MSCTFLMGRRTCQDKCLQLAFLVRVCKCWHHQMKMVPPAWASKGQDEMHLFALGFVCQDRSADRQSASWKGLYKFPSEWSLRVQLAWVFMCLMSDGEMNYLIVRAFGLQNDAFRKPHFRGTQHGEHLHRKRWYATFTGDILKPEQRLACFGKAISIMHRSTGFSFFYYIWLILPASLHNPNHLCVDSTIVCHLAKSTTHPSNCTPISQIDSS